MTFNEADKTAIRDILAAYDVLTAAIREASPSLTLCGTCHRAAIDAARQWTLHSLEDAITWSNHDEQ